MPCQIIYTHYTGTSNHNILVAYENPAFDLDLCKICLPAFCDFSVLKETYRNPFRPSVRPSDPLFSGRFPQNGEAKQAGS